MLFLRQLSEQLGTVALPVWEHGRAECHIGPVLQSWDTRVHARVQVVAASCCVQQHRPGCAAWLFQAAAKKCWLCMLPQTFLARPLGAQAEPGASAAGAAPAGARGSAQLAKTSTPAGGQPVQVGAGAAAVLAPRRRGANQWVRPLVPDVAASRQATVALSAAAGPVSSGARPGGQAAPRRTALGAQAGPAAAAAPSHAATAAPGVPRQPQRRAVYGLQRPNQLLRLPSPATPGASKRGHAHAPAAPVTLGQAGHAAAAASAPKRTLALVGASGRWGASRGRARGGVIVGGGRGRAGRGVETSSGLGLAARQDSSWLGPLVGRVVKSSGLPAAAAARGRGRLLARRAANGRQVHTLWRVGALS